MTPSASSRPQPAGQPSAAHRICKRGQQPVTGQARPAALQLARLLDRYSIFSRHPPATAIAFGLSAWRCHLTHLCPRFTSTQVTSSGSVGVASAATIVTLWPCSAYRALQPCGATSQYQTWQPAGMPGHGYGTACPGLQVGPDLFSASGFLVAVPIFCIQLSCTARVQNNRCARTQVFAPQSTGTPCLGCRR